MTIYSIGCDVPYISNSYGQTQGSLFGRITTIVCGILLLLIGILSLYRIDGLHLLGTTSGKICMGFGLTFIALGVCLKCYKIWHPKDLLKPSSPIYGNPFAVMPVDVLYETFDGLDVPTLFKLRIASKGMYQKVSAYLLNYRCPIESNLLVNAQCSAILYKGIQKEYRALALELCGRTYSGAVEDLSDERFTEILNEMEGKKLLSLIHAVPLIQGWASRMRYETCSALQYAASKGNLFQVKKLVEYGSKDYLCNSPEFNRSALYYAAHMGHIDTVNYLLKNGANAAICFKKINRSNYFIPDFVCYTSEFARDDDLSDIVACFRRIMEYMAIYHMENLRFQLTAPIPHGNSLKNTLKWSQAMCGNLIFLKAVCEILKSYGAKEEDVFSPKEDGRTVEYIEFLK